MDQHVEMIIYLIYWFKQKYIIKISQIKRPLSFQPLFAF